MKLEELIKTVPTLQVRGPLGIEVTGLAYDSRKVRPGYVFIALPGEHTEGSSFVDDAFRRGAVGVVVGRAEGVRRDLTMIQVEDPRFTMARLAAAFHRYPADKLQMAGVTGTNGKTTVTFLLRDILNAAGRSAGMLGTVQYEIGDRIIPATRTTPESVDIQQMLAQMVEKRCQSAVMEVSSHALVQQRAACIDFDVGVFTNLTRDHLDYHQSFENYFAAKQLLFQGLGKGTKKAGAVINCDDPRGRELCAMTGIAAEILSYGFNPKADVCAENVHIGVDGSRCHVRTPAGAAELHIELPGRYNIANALAALAASLVLKVDLHTILNSLSQSRHVPGRLEQVSNRQDRLIFVDYAHTDDALTNVLNTLREFAPRRIIVVFGCGGNRDRTKRPLMGTAATTLADYTVLTSDNPRKEDARQIIAEIEKGCVAGAPYDVEIDRAQAIRKALTLSQPGDVVLIAGKGHECYQEFADVIIPFDDRQVVREMLT